MEKTETPSGWDKFLEFLELAARSATQAERTGISSL
jgi:hypothetical protein